MMRGYCGRRPLEGNLGLILTAVRSDWRIETELQIRFRLDYRFGFGNLTADDEFAGFSGWERKWGYGQGDRLLCNSESI
jgi:hypothetical protein